MRRGFSGEWQGFSRLFALLLHVLQQLGEVLEGLLVNAAAVAVLPGATEQFLGRELVQFNQLTVGKNISNDEKAIHLIVDSLSSLLKIERAILTKSSEINDEGTNSIMSDFISEQEKTIWMMQAWLEE